MPGKIYHAVNTFNSGEVSELLYHRDDISKYKSACRVLENAFPLVEGGTQKMPGTQLAGGIRTYTAPARLVPFQFSTNQGAVLEFTAGFIRIWRPNPPGSWNLQLANIGGVYINLTTPYTQADLFALDCSTQSVDVLWIFHPSYPPACVERFSDTNWVYTLNPPGGQNGEPAYRGTSDVVKSGFSSIGSPIVSITQTNPAVIAVPQVEPWITFGQRIYINLCSGMVEFNQGEFFIVSGANTNTFSVIPAATGTIFTGSISGTTLTVSSVTNGVISVGMQVNGPGVAANTAVTGFLSGTGLAGTYSLNRSESIVNESMWSSEVDSTSFLAYTGGGFVVPVVALFNTPGEYPACGTFYQERLYVGGTNNNPTRVYGSVEDDFSNFICDPNQDDSGVQFTLVSTKLDQILNMIGSPNALLVGVAGGIWVLTGSTGSAISQTNISTEKQTNFGVGQLQPQLIGDSVIFISRSAKIVNFLSFNFATNTWENFDLTRLNRQITIGTSASTSGIVQTGFQSEPYPIFWAVRADGQLLGLVFNRQDQVFAWFRINMLPEQGTIESVAVISSQNNEDMVAIEVSRFINNTTVRYVEFFMPQELFNNLGNAFFVHCGIMESLPPGTAITGITNANPPTVTSPGHTLANGSFVQITGVVGMASPVQGINQPKTQAYTVINSNPSAGTFQLGGMDTTTWLPYISGGIALPVTNQITGLTYLLGQQVVAVGDSALISPGFTVMTDVQVFPYYCNNIVVGLPYQMTVQPVNPVNSTGTHTTRGVKQKLDTVTISVRQSMGGQYGTDLGHMYDITYDTGSMGQLPTMASTDVTRNIDADWGDESTFIITQNVPFPFTLRGLVMRMSYNLD